MEFENISLKEGIRLSRDKENYILMDVREKDRYKEGHLEYAVSCPYGILKEGILGKTGLKSTILLAEFIIIWKKKSKISWKQGILQELTVDEK